MLPFVLAIAVCELPESMQADSLTVDFETNVCLRFIGFDESVLGPILKPFFENQILRVDVIADSNTVHHSFRATSEFINSAELSSLSGHFQQNKCDMAVYIAKKGLGILLENGTGWAVIEVEDNWNGISLDRGALKIIARVVRLLKDVFHKPLSTRPRFNITRNHDTITIYNTRKSIFKGEKVSKRSLSFGTSSFNFTTIEIEDKDLQLLCSVCNSSECIERFLRNLIEYESSSEDHSLPVFLLPPECRYRYGSVDLAFASTDSEKSLQYVLWQSEYNCELNSKSEPFKDIIARRNFLAYPLHDAITALKQIVTELNDLQQLDKDVIPAAAVEKLSELFKNYSLTQGMLTRAVLADEQDKWPELWDQLTEIIGHVSDMWMYLSGRVERRRSCVGLLRDLTEHLPIFARPMLYCCVSVVATLVMLVYIRITVGKWKLADPLRTPFLSK